MRVTLLDGSIREFKPGTNVKDIALLLEYKLTGEAVYGNVNGKLVNLSTIVEDGDRVEIITENPTTDPNEGLNFRKKSTKRLIALDAVRGLAVIGMFLQHFSLNEWNSFVAGNTTLLFILCGGISYSIMAQRMTNKGINTKTFRTTMLARAIFIVILGYVLIMLNTPFGVILPAYAALFILSLLLISQSTRVLVLTTISLLVLSPLVMIIGQSIFSDAPLLSDIAGGPMSSVALTPAFVAGMALGRIDLTNVRTQVILVSSGFLLIAVNKILSGSVISSLNLTFEQWLVKVGGSYVQPDPYAIWPLNVEPIMWHTLLWTSPHSASTFHPLHSFSPIPHKIVHFQISW